MKKLLTSAFVFGGIAAGSLLSTPAANATHPNCIYGVEKQNLNTVINPDDTVTITTKDARPLCLDVVMYWDSYTMPTSYNGQPVNDGANKSALPMTRFDSTKIVFKADTNTTTAKVKLPQGKCQNFATALYNAPEITKDNAWVHLDQFINGEINGHGSDYKGNLAADQDACKPVTPVTPTTPTTPATPATPETPATPVTPAKGEATPVVTELPSTGTSENLTLIIAAVLAAGTYGISRFVAKKHNSVA